MSPSSYIIPTLEFGDLSRIILGLSRVYLSLLNYVRLWASTKCSNYFKFDLAFCNQDLHPLRGFPSLYTRTTQIASLCYKLATTVLSLVVFPQACESMQHQRASRVSLKSELRQPSAWCADVCQYIGYYRPHIFHILWVFFATVLELQYVAITIEWFEARKDLGWMAVLGYSLSTLSVALYVLLGSVHGVSLLLGPG